MSDFSSSWGNYLLKDITQTATPDGVSWWPQTLGWKILLVALFMLLCVRVYRAVKQYQLNAYRREAIAWLGHLPDYQPKKPEPVFREIPGILRKVAIAGFHRKDVILPVNVDWEKWLDKQCNKTQFSQQNSGLLYQLAYQPEYEISHQQMLALINDVGIWIKHHRGIYD